MTLQEVLWLFSGGLLGVVVACGVAYVFVGIESFTRLRRHNVEVATTTPRQTTNAPPPA